MNEPLLTTCDCLVVGGGIAAMSCALTLAERGAEVLLCAPGTCLYQEIAETGDLRPPLVTTETGRRLFPQGAREPETGLLHPDRLKRGGEDLLLGAGVRLLYACEVVRAEAPRALAAHKSGLYQIACKRVLDCRRVLRPASPALCLSVLTEETHRLLPVPVKSAARTASAQFSRVEEALAQLPAGSRLGRGGVFATEALGLDVEGEIAAGQLAADERAALSAKEAPSAAATTGQLAADGQAALSTKEATPAADSAGAQEAYDVMVAGGGTAGAVAAIHCARLGLRTLVLEMNDALGGTATCGGVSCYWFGLREGATREIDHAVQALYDRLGMARRPGLWSHDDAFLPDLKAHALLGLCLEAGAEVRFGSVVCGAEMSAGRVTGLCYARAGQLWTVQSRMVLDCTGDGDVCVLAGADATYGNAGDGMTFWASLAQFSGPDRYRNNFSTMVRVDDPFDYTRFILAGRRRGDAPYDHGRYVAVRESRHVRGLETLTLSQILRMDPCGDPLYVCFSNYDPKGRLTAELAYFGFLPPNQRIPVSRGAVIPAGRDGRAIGGLLVGGKAISCDHDAFPALRMQPDLQAQGLALAALTACSLAQGVEPMAATGVREMILRCGGAVPETPIAPAERLRDTVARLRGDEPWEELDAPVTAFAEIPSPICRVLLAERDEAVPLLTRALATAKGTALRLTLSRLLLWHGSDAGAPEVLAALDRELNACEGLPRRQASVNYGQLLPDHGLMPEAAYLLCSLSRASRAVEVAPVFARVLERLTGGVRDWKDLRAGIYCYGESFAFVAKRRRDPAFVPLLRRVLSLPELTQEPEDELLRERSHMLRLALLDALLALGDEGGRTGLAKYEDDPRGALATAARLLLAQGGNNDGE